jgi:predicted ATPase/DNA-binding SARP family transcriptional activator
MLCRALGPIGVELEPGKLVHLRPTLRRLLAAFLVDVGKVVSVDKAIDALWGDTPPARPEATLQIHVSRLRKAFGRPDVVATRAPGYLLRVEDDQFDVAVFERLLGEARNALEAGSVGPADEKLIQAQALWQGPAYVEYADESFAQIEARRLEGLRLASEQLHLDCLIRLGRAAEAIPNLEMLIGADPLDEQAARLFATALYAEGRQAEALRALDRTRLALRDHIGAVPTQRSEDLYEAILRQELVIAPEKAATAEQQPTDSAIRSTRTGRARLTNLPQQLTTFVGRRWDLERLQGLIDTQRLVTVTGPGGIGKTRLALQAATDLLGSYVDGVWLVEMGELTATEQVVAAVVETLPLSDGPAPSSIDLLTEWLEDRELLVILDDCERMVEPLATLAGHLLAHCPALRVVATSREALGVPGETLFHVPLLVAPDERWTDLKTIGANESVQLFVDRAALVNSDFTLNEAAAPLVMRICRALDGIPLAIELAASHSRRRSLAEVADLVERDAAHLSSPYRLVTARQRTMGATVDWSYDLLPDPAKGVFRRLSVLVGRFDGDAASAVCGMTVDAASPILDRLADQSLLVDVDGIYRMLQPVRARAREMLSLAGEEAETTIRHARHFLGMAAEAGRGLRGQTQGLWVRRLARYIPEVRAAIEWGFVNDPGLVVEAGLGVSDFLYMSDSFTETMALLRRCLGVATPQTRDRIELRMARVLSKESPAEAVIILEDLLDRSLTPELRLEARLWATLAYDDLGRFDRAASLLVTPEEADDSGEPWLRVEARRVASIRAFMDGNIQDMIANDRSAYELAVAHGLPWQIVMTANNLAWDLAFHSDGTDTALELVGEAQQVAREVGSPILLAWNRTVEAAIRAITGQATDALSDFVEVMYDAIATGMSYRFLEIEFEQLAYMLLETGRLEEAARCHGAAHPAPEDSPYFASAQFHTQVVQTLGEELGTDVMRRLEDDGRTTPRVDLLDRVAQSGPPRL